MKDTEILKNTERKYSKAGRGVRKIPKSNNKTKIIIENKIKPKQKNTKQRNTLLLKIMLLKIMIPLLGLLFGIVIATLPFMIIISQKSVWLMLQKHYRADNSITLQIHDYLEGQSNIEELPNTLTINEKKHLIDVKKVFGAFKKSILVLTALTLFAMIIAIKTLKHILKIITIAIIISFLIIILIAIALIMFNKSFEMFHKLFFKENYVFPENSALITAFPPAFFKAITGLALATSILLTTSLLFVRIILKNIL